MLVEFDAARTPFNLGFTLSCGQVFRWEQKGKWWVGAVGQNALKVLQRNEAAVEFVASAGDVGAGFLRWYFRLDDDLPQIYRRICKDRFVREGVERFCGLRLLRQEPWECLASYICATFKNIPSIKRMVNALSERFGSVIMFEGQEFYGFPDCHDLAGASLGDLRKCGLGYRARYLRDTARIVDCGEFDLEGLRELPYESAKKELMSLPGVGPKVADCVLLFSLDKLEAFPVDVWMKRMVLARYSEHFEPEFVRKLKTGSGLSDREYRAVYEFGRGYFGEFVGYAQEYLYHFERCRERRVRRS